MNAFRFSALLFVVILFSNLQIRAQSDDCGNAVKITNVNKYCSNPNQFSNIGFTWGGLALANCWSTNASMDGWFRFTALGTDVQITVSGEPGKGTIKKPNIELIAGGCGGTSLACSPSNTTDVTVLYKGGLVPGNTYYIRIATTSANRGTFMLCVSSYTPTVNPGADCDGAVRLCDKSQVLVPGLSGGGKNPYEPEANSCFSSSNPSSLIESNSSWFWWTCDKAGTLTFDIIPIDPSKDLDFILYELATDKPCGIRKIIRCTATQCVYGANGLNMTAADSSEPVTTKPNPYCPPQYNGYLKYVNMIAGKSYALMINNYSNNSGFTINFGGNGTIKGPKAVIMSATLPQICVGGSITYDGSQSQFYDSLSWMFPGGNPATAINTGPHKIDYNVSGTYVTYLKAINKTCASGNSIDSIKITILQPPILTLINDSVSNTDCDKPTGSITGIIVTGKPAFKYEWFTPPATSVSTSTTTPDLINMPPGIYYLVVTDSTTCKDTAADYEIKNFDTPATPDVSDNIPYCEGVPLGPITAAGNGGTYIWFDDADLKDTVHVGPVYTPVNTKTDTLYLTETVHGCTSDVDTVVIMINPLPVVDAGPLKHIICSLPSVELQGSASGGPLLSYSWSPSNGIASGGNTLTPFINKDGIYTLTVKNDNTGCTKNDEVEVIKDPVPVAAYTADFYKGESPLKVVFTNNSTGSNTYLWLLDGEDHPSTEKNPSYTYITPKIYNVLLIASDSNKCPDTIRVEINVYEKFMVEIPNVFTPNGDGINDVFKINTTGITEMSGEIYDRWGLKLYSWEQKNGGWDGHSLTGLIAPEGTYFYILKIKPQDGKETYIKAGQLTLLR